MELFLYILDNDVDNLGGLYEGVCPSNSGCASTAGEVIYLIQVLKHSPLFGYGVGYGFGDIHRSMGLNGVVELTIRFGLLGFVLFFIAILKGNRNKFSLFIFILAYMSAYGNIGQAFFWILLSLIYIVHAKPKKEPLNTLLEK